MDDAKQEELAVRLAATTAHDADDWRQAIRVWTSAGNDLDRLYEWAAGGQQVTPSLVVDAVQMQAVYATPVVAELETRRPLAWHAGRIVAWLMAWLIVAGLLFAVAAVLRLLIIGGLS